MRGSKSPPPPPSPPTYIIILYLKPPMHLFVNELRQHRDKWITMDIPLFLVNNEYNELPKKKYVCTSMVPLQLLTRKSLIEMCLFLRIFIALHYTLYMVFLNSVTIPSYLDSCWKMKSWIAMFIIIMCSQIYRYIYISMHDHQDIQIKQIANSTHHTQNQLLQNIFTCFDHNSLRSATITQSYM